MAMRPTQIWISGHAEIVVTPLLLTSQGTESITMMGDLWIGIDIMFSPPMQDFKLMPHIRTSPQVQDPGSDVFSLGKDGRQRVPSTWKKDF